jgi:hypothetical protein
LSQQQHGAPIVQPPLYTTVQPQQKINLLQPTVIDSTASLLSQQQQKQQQARTQIVCFYFYLALSHIYLTICNRVLF